MRHHIRDLFPKLGTSDPASSASSKDGPPSHVPKRPPRPKIAKPNLPKLLPPSGTFSFAAPDKANHIDRPPNLGRIGIPEGISGCLHGITFTATGTLNSITRDTLRELIVRYGGTLANSVSSRTDILIRGVKDVGKAKLESAIAKNIPVIDEGGFFDLITQSNPDGRHTPPAAAQTGGRAISRLELSPLPSDREPRSPTDSQSRSLVLSTEPRCIPQRTGAQRVPQPRSVHMPPESPTDFRSGGQQPDPSATSESAAPSPDFQARSGSDRQRTHPRPPRDPGLPDVPLRPTSCLLAEKYRPRCLDDLVGNSAVIDRLRRWLTNFSRQDKKAALISGPPGVGKSTAVMLLATLCGYHVLEFNASDTRNRSSMERVASPVFSSETVLRFADGHSSSTRTCVVFDEIDGRSGWAVGSHALHRGDEDPRDLHLQRPLEREA